MRNILKESDNKITGHPISFIDIDETTMHTFAKVNVMKDGEVVKSLDNQEFNTHELNDGETYNFDNFRDAKFFNQTSKPIEKTINRIKNIIQSIKDNKKQEKVIFLTARADFDDKETFLDTFRNFGIDVDIPNVYIERSGNLTNIKSVADRKKYVILKYLKTGLYTVAKMYDDDKKNLETFEELGQEVNAGRYGILDNVKDNFPRVNKIGFYPLLVTNSGKIRTFESKKSDEEVLLEVNAYHGSHKNFDEFDTKYIGTGEKCQAHGWGLYFALNPKTAKGYHERISGYHNTEKRNGTDISLSYKGKRYDDDSVQGKMIKMLYKKGKKSTLTFLNNLNKESQFTKNPEEFRNNIRRLYNMINNIDSEEIKENISIKSGQYYVVKIPELNMYLDEDRKMYMQSKEVIDICKNILIKLNQPFKAKNLLGREFYRKLGYYSFTDGSNLKNVDKNSDKAVSEFLNKNGIVGIKYDGHSDGNCVVIFNKADVKIIEKGIDYESNKESGIEMTEITKFIEDPKKLKGKRVSKEIIDWFIENRPELIDNTIINAKMDDEQKLKTYLYNNDLRYNEGLMKRLIEEKSKLDILPIAEIIYYIRHSSDYIRHSDEEFDFNKIMDLIKSIPLNVRKNYLLKCGNAELNAQYGSNITNIEQIEIFNEFYKGITIDDAESINKFSSYNFVYNQDSYKEYIDIIKYLICDKELSYGSLHSDAVFDNIMIECMEKKKHSMNIVGNNFEIFLREKDLNIDKKLLPRFVDLLKFDEDGFYSIRCPNIDLYEKALKYYSDDVIKTFNNCEYSKLPIIIRMLLRISPIKTILLNDKLFELLLNNNSSYYEFLDKNIIKEFNDKRRKMVFIYVLKNYIYLPQEKKNKFIELIKEKLFDYKECIYECFKNVPSLLQYFDIPYNIQKVICSKNPYMIKYISNPDKNLVNVLKQKYNNIDDYINYGDD